VGLFSEVVLGVDPSSLELEVEAVVIGRLGNSEGRAWYSEVSLVVSGFSLEEHGDGVSSSEGILLSFAILGNDGGLNEWRR
jgi:hypothetical protein